jgi:hypothetical protein
MQPRNRHGISVGMELDLAIAGIWGHGGSETLHKPCETGCHAL